MADSSECKTVLRWIGHAGFHLEVNHGHNQRTVLVVDAWFDNPLCTEQDRKLPPPDYVLVTHGHFDHSASAVPLCKDHHAKLISIYEVGQWAKNNGVPEDRVMGMNKGGTVDLEHGIRVTMVTADHSSGCPGDNGMVEGGQAAAFVIHLPDGNSIYHAGDTNVFTDMRIISDLYKPNIALLPVGGRFTMGPEEVWYALTNFLHSVKHVVPMHFATFPLLKGNPEQLEKLMASDRSTEVTLHKLKPIGNVSHLEITARGVRAVA